MTRPENAKPTDVQLRSEQPDAAAEPAESAENNSAQRRPSGNGATPVNAPPLQRQRNAPEDMDQKTVRLPTGKPEQSRGAASSAAPASPSTVRIGGYTPPERVAPAQPADARVRPARVPRRTSLQLQQLDPWSVLKISLVLSVAGFLAWMVAVGVLYGALGGMGVWDQLNGTYSDLTSVNNPEAGTALISGGRVFGVALVIGLVNIVLMTALATVGSLIYNIATDLVGGIEVTLSEPD
ncbi:MAG: DUF3566 domain-containing protein [Pseudonocardiaceae bacterium]